MQGKLLPAELRLAFLAAVLTRDGPDLKMNAPHRLMNLWALLGIGKTMLNPALYTELRNEIKDAMDVQGDRYCQGCLAKLDGFSLLWCMPVQTPQGVLLIDSYTNSLSITYVNIFGPIQRFINIELAAFSAPSSKLKREFISFCAFMSRCQTCASS